MSDYSGSDSEVDPYRGTKFPVGSLKRREELLADPNTKRSRVDGKRKIKQSVKGDSMKPDMNPGDEVITDLDTSIDQIRPGDDVTFINNNGDGSESYFTHRVKQVYKNPLGGTELVTQGTNRTRPERARVTNDTYIGKARNTGPTIVGGP